jgi:hypothetical protein
VSREQSIGRTRERQEGADPQVSRSIVSKRRVDFEIIQGATISESDLDFLARMFAKVISRNLEADTSKTSQKGENCDHESKTKRP